MKTHLSLSTAKLDESVAFYGVLLGAQPLKHYDDYALFVTENPGLELALERRAQGRIGKGEHFGIAVETSDAVHAATARLTTAGLRVTLERGTCCYAEQEKVWARDPDGRRWEVYHVLEESQERQGARTTCCTDKTRDTYDQCCAK